MPFMPSIFPGFHGYIHTALITRFVFSIDAAMTRGFPIREDF